MLKKVLTTFLVIIINCINASDNYDTENRIEIFQCRRIALQSALNATQPQESLILILRQTKTVKVSGYNNDVDLLQAIRNAVKPIEEEPNTNAIKRALTAIGLIVHDISTSPVKPGAEYEFQNTHPKP